MDKEQLFESDLPEDEVPIPGKGTVRVRGLSRAESLRVGQVQGGWVEKEQLLLHYGMVDPKMTKSDVARWQQAAGNSQIDEVSNKVAELSGMLDGAGKSAYADFRGSSGPGAGVLPGRPAVNDSQPVAAGDASG